MKTKSAAGFLLIALFFAFFLTLVSAQSCGNGSCETGENSCTCEKDCGTCEGDVSGQLCRAYACADNQCTIYTVAGCCGNNACENNENYGNCPVDCLPTSITIELQDAEKLFLRGDDLLIKVKATADGRSVNSAKITAKGFFGEVDLFNDGKHNDERNFDSIYANTVEISPEINAGTYNIFIEGSFLTVDGNTNYQVEVNPKLDVELDTESNYSLGGIVEVKGIISKRETGVAMPVKLEITTGSKIIDTQETDTDQNGNFTYAFHSSLADLSGIWKIKVTGEDQFGNIAEHEQGVLMSRPVKVDPLNIELLNEFKNEYDKLETVEFIVKVVDEQFNYVNDANLQVVLPGNKSVKLHELEPGKYLGSVLLERRIPSGEQEIKIVASVEKNGSTLQGNEIIKFKINPVQLNMKIISPKKLTYEVGEEMELKVEVTDATEKEVNDAIVKAKIGNDEIELRLFEIGTYRAVFLPTESHKGKLKVFLSAEDSYGDASFVEREVEVAGKNLLYTVLQNIIVFGILAILGLTAAALIFFIFLRKSNIKNLQDKLDELDRFEKKAQEMYFHRSEISKEEYTKLMEKYENEIKEAKMKLNAELSKK